jgi:hypothetical protein
MIGTGIRLNPNIDGGWVFGCLLYLLILLQNRIDWREIKVFSKAENFLQDLQKHFPDIFDGDYSSFDPIGPSIPESKQEVTPSPVTESSKTPESDLKIKENSVEIKPNSKETETSVEPEMTSFDSDVDTNQTCDSLDHVFESEMQHPVETNVDEEENLPVNLQTKGATNLNNFSKSVENEEPPNDSNSNPGLGMRFTPTALLSANRLITPQILDMNKFAEANSELTKSKKIVNEKGKILLNSASTDLQISTSVCVLVTGCKLVWYSNIYCTVAQ